MHNLCIMLLTGTILDCMCAAQVLLAVGSHNRHMAVQALAKHQGQVDEVGPVHVRCRQCT